MLGILILVKIFVGCKSSLISNKPFEPVLVSCGFFLTVR